MYIYIYIITIHVQYKLCTYVYVIVCIYIYRKIFVLSGKGIGAYVKNLRHHRLADHFVMNNTSPLCSLIYDST